MKEYILLFESATLATLPNLIDPLILDLDGDGIQTTDVEGGTYFDHDGDGFAEQTGWAAPGDGLLVRDVNKNGTIDSGKELFGDQTILKNGSNAVNGFQALADLDDNGDGKIDSNDAVWSDLKIWQDFDGDGLSAPDELHTLEEVGIQSINIDSTPTGEIDSEGNIQARIGSFEKTGGNIGEIGGYNLQRNTTYTIAEVWLEVPEDIAALPNLQASNNIYELQQAIVRDSSGQLKAIVEQFIATTDVNTRKNIMNQIIFRWAGTDGIAVNSRGANVDAKKLATLEKFFGQEFVGANGSNPTSAAAIPLNESFRRLSEMFYAQLMVQTHLKDLYSKIYYTCDDTTLKVKADMSAITTDIQAALSDNYDQGKTLLSEFSRILRGLGAQDMVDYLSFRETFISQDPSLDWVIDSGGLPVYDEKGEGQRTWSPHIEGTNNADAVIGSLTEGDGYINGLAGSDAIYGTSRNETLINRIGDSILVAGAGNDRIWAGDGDDILDGGIGNDQLKGEGGNDTYIFRLGSGQDKIIDTDSTEGNTDTIWIGSNLTPDDITLRRVGNNLVVKINNTTDTMTVQDFFKNDSPLNRVEQIQFMDGTIWDVDAISDLILVPSETDDIIYGTSGDDTLHGLGGNDTIYGTAGNDLIYGDSGNDTLYGGAGNDTYIFNRGSGQDIIDETDMTAGNIDIVEFGEDIAPSDIKIERSGNYDIKLSIIDTQDSLLIKDCVLNHDSEFRKVIEQFKFADGTVWSSDTIKEILFLTGTDDSESIAGFSDQDYIQGLGGNDYLYGLGGDDTIEGGSGNDRIYSHSGNDILTGGEGDDTLYGESGNDIYDGGQGDDILYGSNSNGWNYYGPMPYTYNSANGDDIYLFGRGYGNDTVVDRDKTPGNIDTILLGSDIVPDDILIQHKKNDLVLTIKDTGDKLTVLNWFFDESAEWQIEHIQFADGTVWDVNAIKAKVLLGTDANDILIGYNTDDIISGFNGTDFLYGRKGDDTISGGAGNDWIYGEAGSDTLSGNEDIDVIYGGDGDDIINGGTGVDYLHGGTGNDIISGDEGDDFLEGNEGSDTFIFKAGSGQDVIRGSDSEVSSIDTILIDEGITTDSIQIRRNEDDLVVTKKDTGDSMTVENWFADEGNESERIDEIRFADGTVWDIAMLKQLALEGTSEAEVLTGYSSDDIMDGKEGDDVLTGKTGNDTYVFAPGYGKDIIYEADDLSAGFDTVLIKDILPSEVELKASGYDLCIVINDTNDRLEIKDWFLGERNGIDQIVFESDATIWTRDDIEAMSNTPSELDDTIIGTVYSDVIDGGGGNDNIYGLEENDTLFGGDGNDEIYGGEGNDSIYGGAGNDYYLDAGSGTNTIEGGPGDDVIITEQGENTISFGRGDGFDTVWSRFVDSPESYDTIKFGPGITPDDLSIQLSVEEQGGVFYSASEEPVMSVMGIIPGGGIQVKLAIGIGNNEGMLINASDELGGFEATDLAIKKFVFADGQELTLQDIITRADNGVIGDQYGWEGNDFLRGSVANDNIYGYEGNDRIEALGQNDNVSAGSGNDVVAGGFGNDDLFGEAGDDVIAGGPGEDYIEGGAGNDVYAFNRGDGLDYIDNSYDWNAGDVDTISFGADISPEDIKGYIDEYGDLMLRVGESTDEIWTDFYYDTNLPPDESSISRVQFIDANGNARIFDLTGIIESLKNDLIQAYDNDEDPIPLFTEATNVFEITGTVDMAGGDYAVAYAQTGDLFAQPETYIMGDSDDIINARAGDDTIDAGGGNNIVNAGDGDNNIITGSGDDRITSGSGDDFIYDEGGQNNISTGAGNDWIIVGADTDIIEAGEGDDTIEGLGGNDIISGGSGDDTYFFNLGEGNLTINDLADVTGGNRIILGENIIPDDLKLIAGQDSFTIMVGDQGDSITLNSFNPADVYGTRAVNSYEFDSGEVLTYEQLIAKGFEISGTETDDLISGTNTNDTITTFGGDDIINAGQGNDTIDGGSGNDTYIFNLGDGIDTIIDATAQNAGNMVEFGAGISISDLNLKVEDNALVIEVGQNGDALRLEGFNPDDAYGVHAVEEFKFSDGSVFTYADILGLGFTFTGTSGSDELSGTSADDTFIPGTGNDDIYGGTGNDSYYFNTGDGADIINDESTLEAPNTLIFGAGIIPDDIRLSHDPDLNILIITPGNSGDSISITGFDANDPYGSHAIEYFQFEGGQILTYGELIDRGFDIIGANEDDILSGTAAVDRIYGNSGNDTLAGGMGNDILTGGEGDDTYIFNQGDGIDIIDDIADASEGNTLVFGEGITLEDMNRSISFSDGKLIIRIGETGNEVHLTGFDPDEADYGTHAVDNFQFADGTIINYEQLVQNTFIVQGGSGDDNLSGTNVTDRLYGYEGSDILNGNSGDDTLTGGTQDDTLYGGTGDDTYVFNIGDGADTIYDVASAGEGNLIYFGEGISSEDLSIAREDGILTINVGTGEDSIKLMNFDPSETSGSLTVRTIEFFDGTTMNVTDLLGTEGDDIITTGSGDDTINGKGGNDIITTGEGSDTITGGTGNDILSGGAHNDTYIYNLGDGLDTINDISAPGEGNRIVFGPGIAPVDITLTFENTTLKINVGNSGDGILLPGFDPNDAATAKVVETFEFENFTEIAFADFIQQYGIHITGTDGDDNITGTSAYDNISGLAGNDIINGGTGADVMTGGLGNDSYFVDNTGDSVIESLNEGDDSVNTSISYSLPENVENLILSGSDTIDGTGNDLDNNITGNAAANILNGGDGADTLSGNAGDDSIYGEGGADILSGGEGVDLLSGGAGNDTYIFNIGDGFDTIEDTSTLAEGNTILFGEGITASDLTLIDNNGSLLINVGSNGDAINLLNFDIDEIAGSLVVRTLQFADGSQKNLTDFFNQPPIIENPITDQITMEDAAFSFTVPGNTFSDIDAGDSLTYSATLADGTPLPSWLTFDAETITFSGTPVNDNVGILPLKITATDTAGESVSDEFNLTIENVNDAPVVVYPITDQTTMEDTVFSFTVPGNTFADIDLGDSLTYSATLSDGTPLPSWLTFDAETMTFSGTAVGIGTKSIEVTATDSAGVSVSSSFNIDVQINVIVGTENDDNLIGTMHSNLIYGLGGNDTIEAGDGDDILTGGIGNDILYGGDGNDQYIYNTGDGLDSIYDSAGSDTIILGTGLDFDHTVIRKDDTYAHLRVLDEEGNETDQGIDIVLNPDGTMPIENVSFSGEPEIDINDFVIESKVTWGTIFNDNIQTGRHDDTIYGFMGSDTIHSGSGNDTIYGGMGQGALFGEDGNDTIYGSLFSDTMDGGNGNDILYGNSGNDNLIGGNGEDLLYGESGNDTLYGGSGNDTINGGSGSDNIRGGAGNDILNGEYGSDTYLFSRTDGKDIINEPAGYFFNFDNDIIKMTDGISSTEPVIVKQDDDLYLFVDENNYMKITDQFENTSWFYTNGIERLEVTDGQYITRQDIDNIVNTMSAINNDAGMDIIQKYNAMQNDQTYINILSQSWQQG
ncbi:MAG: putative Ig domain-containing protein [Proteobacteria bacterium]|nr:putative Ig domain-containing protein [Pseudomonadota bacterium]